MWHGGEAALGSSPSTKEGKKGRREMQAQVLLTAAGTQLNGRALA